MDIRGIRYFIRAAETLNFTQAAKDCYITQTAMSQHIANMEKELGFDLFIRNNRNIELTVAGKNYYDHMKKLVHAYDNAVTDSRNLAKGNKGTITVAVQNSIEGEVLMPRFRYFCDHYPEINLNISITSPRYMQDKLASNEADVCISWPYDVDNDKTCVQNIAEFRAIIVCRGDHHLASLPKISPLLLNEEKITVIDFQALPDTYKAHCLDWQSLGLDFTRVRLKNIHRLEELLFVVSTENAIALVPEFMRHHMHGDYAFIELDVPRPLMFQQSAVYLLSNRNPILPNLIDILRDNRIPLNY